MKNLFISMLALMVLFLACNKQREPTKEKIAIESTSVAVPESVDDSGIAATPSSTPPEPSKKVKLMGEYNNLDQDGFVNLRQIPKGFIIRQVLLSEQFIILEFNPDDWSIVKTNSGEVGYIKSNRIRLIIDNNPVSDLLPEQNKTIRPNIVDALPCVIESTIDGDFNGFEMNKEFKLSNGQIWQQDELKYRNGYRFRPEVTIVKSGMYFKMFVNGMGDHVRVRLIEGNLGATIQPS